MTTYRYTDETRSVVHIIDGDGVARRSMLAEQVPAGSEIAPEGAMTADQFMAHVTDCAQQRLDVWAKTRGYDGIVSLCSYATSANPTFGAEGQRGVVLRDATWQALIDLKQAVINGERSMPGSWEAVEAELPALTWSGE